MLPETTITWVRAVFDGPQDLATSPAPPMSFGP